MRYLVTLMFTFYVAANYGRTASISQSTSVINNQRCVKTCTDEGCQTTCSPLESGTLNSCVVCNNNVCTTCDQNPEEARRIETETKQRISAQQEELRLQMSNMQNQLQRNFQQMNFQLQENMRNFKQRLPNIYK